MATRVTRLSEDGRAICRIAFKPYEKLVMQHFKFKIDTGADFSTMPKEYLYDLGYDKDWILANAKPETNRETTTATGERVTNHIIQLPLINIYGYEAINWPFAILLDDERPNGEVICRDYRPLLGLDLLAGFNFYLDNANNRFELTRISPFNPRRKFLSGQEIHYLNN
ncbi:MAG: retropepsin-like domain-containing protein [Defluviitaleaceae bacterium]|nr:retropepsin-like domain-containing protein [Defluviitaleaceae bacterium]MCL2262774.1 retropepsin-like domain-containing protein [Defluviitaleaceae bacterium]